MQKNLITDEAKQLGETSQIVVFKIGGEEYALPISHIKEVVETPGITRLPQTPEFIKGVANIRGNIIAILDLESKFGLEKDASLNHKKKYTLVLEHKELKIGILVQEVPNTLSIKRNHIESPGFATDNKENIYISGIIKLDKRLIILIDVFKLLGDPKLFLTKYLFQTAVS